MVWPPLSPSLLTATDKIASARVEWLLWMYWSSLLRCKTVTELHPLHHLQTLAPLHLNHPVPSTPQRWQHQSVDTLKCTSKLLISTNGDSQVSHHLVVIQSNGCRFPAINLHSIHLLPILCGKVIVHLCLPLSGVLEALKGCLENLHSHIQYV